MKPPSVPQQRIEMMDLSGSKGHYDADKVRYRPAGYGILQVDGRLLLSRSRFTGLWDFPGGGVEPFEWLGDGMAREYFEETHLLVRAGDIVHVGESYIAMFGHPYHSLRFYFRAYLQDGQRVENALADPGEITELGWFSPAASVQLPMDDGNRMALENFLRMA